jgi:hypothetical protein
MHNYHAAKSDFDLAIRLDPTDGAIYLLRGLAYLDDMKQYAAAARDFTTAIRLDPADENAFNGRGLAYLNLGQYDRALRDFKAEARFNPIDAVADLDRGMAQDLLGHHDLAVRAYDAALIKLPGGAYALSQRCLAKIATGQDPQSALADCDHAILIKEAKDEQMVSPGVLQSKRGLAYALTGNFAAARGDCDAARAYRDNSNHVLDYVRYVCGLVAVRAGDAARGNADMAAVAPGLRPFDVALLASYSPPPVGPPAATNIGGAARLEMVLLADDPASATGAALHDAHDPNKAYFVARDITLPGDIEGMDSTVTAQGEPALELHLATDAQKRIGDPSLMDHQIALVLDGRTVLAAATVREPLSTTIMLTGDFTSAEIRELVAAIYPPDHQDSFLAWMERVGVWYLGAALLLIALGVGVGRLLPRRTT